MHSWHSDTDNNWSTYEMFKVGITLNSGGKGDFCFLMTSQHFDSPSRQTKENMKDKTGKNSSHGCP